MTSNPNTATDDAGAPDPNQAGPAMPENIARLLYVLRILLEYGRHLTATIERRATGQGFWLFRAVFGTATLSVIMSHLRRGILRATALESLLLQHAAAGRDVAPSPLAPAAAGDAATSRPMSAADTNADPCNEPFSAQVARLTAERTQYDIAIDPNNLATPEQIEAEVRARPIGRTIADIRRDLGIIAMLCKREFWDTVADAIARYEDSIATCPQDASPEPEPLPQTPQEDSSPERTDRAATLSPRQFPSFKPGRRATVPFRATAPFRATPAHPGPHDNVPLANRRAAGSPAATGPPRHPAVQRAA